eukprot:1190435-Prorocentrum_minimum.AAC.1
MLRLSSAIHARASTLPRAIHRARPSPVRVHRSLRSSTICRATMEKITFGDGLPGYICGPKGAPALLVVQEWWGVTDIVQEQAELLSTKSGYRCLIPDLYKGKIGVDAEEASHLMNNLDFMNAVEEIKQGIAFLKAEGSAKVGITGFCMGGALTFAAASKVGHVLAPAMRFIVTVAANMIHIRIRFEVDIEPDGRRCAGC